MYPSVQCLNRLGRIGSDGRARCYAASNGVRVQRGKHANFVPHLGEWKLPSVHAVTAITFYDSGAPLTEGRARLDRRLAGIAAEFATQWELNRVDSALAQLQSGRYGKTYWGLSDRVPEPEGRPAV